MAKFNADLLRVLALGPSPSIELMTLIDSVEDEEKRVRKAYARCQGRWTVGQIKLQEESRELLYAAIMLRAAAFLENSHQDGNVKQHKKIAAAEICIRITSDTFEVAANNLPDGTNPHAKAHPSRKTTKAASTDNKVRVATYDDLDDGYCEAVIDKFKFIGFACPPD